MIQLARLDVRRSNGVVVATITGEIDMSNATDLRGALVGQLSNHTTGLVIDLTGVTYLDSAAIHLIYELRSQLASRRVELRLVVPDGAATLPALSLTGVPDVVQVFDTVAEAEASIG
ncbi:MAG TPA: STAS domain-containing protein [Solirubrobacteraceae bacterium]|jgi:anti-anti-sigma factor